MNRVNKSWALDKSDKLRKGCSPLIFKVTEGFEPSLNRRARRRLRNCSRREDFDDLSHLSLLHLFTALWERIENPQDGGKLYDLRNANLCAETRHDC
jgi:hypothetical protein